MPRTLLGKPLQWNNDQLDALSSVTDADMQSAILAWQDAADEPWDELPLAPPQTEEEDSALPEILVGGLLLAASTVYTWNATLGVYVLVATQDVVSFSVVRDIAEQVAQQSLSEMALLSKQLQAGEITLAEWQIGIAQRIKTLQINAMVAARGGWAQMSQADWGYAGSQIKKQYQYLRNFAEQIANGTQKLDGTFLYRTGMYEDAARGSYEDMRRRIEQLYNGMEEESRDLGYADHCDDCLEINARGWQPIGTLPRIGESVCRTNCHCHFRFRRLSPNGYVYSGE